MSDAANIRASKNSADIGGGKPAVLVPHSGHSDWLDANTLRTLTVTDILARIDAIKDLIGAGAGEAERLRHPVDEVWSAIRKTGMFYLYVPRKFGGLEVNDFQAFIDIVLPIAEQCTSTAWCAAFSIHHQWVLNQFPEKFQAEMWNKLPYYTSAGSGFPPGKAVKVEGGYRITGHWKWGSGIVHAEWVNSIVLAESDDGEKLPYFAYVPIEQVTVLDTWYVDGMCGTGSHDYQINNVFVPDHRILNFNLLSKGQLHHENPFYRIPGAPVLALVAAVPALGAARAAVKRFRERVATGSPGGTPSDNALFHACLGRAEMEVTTAESVIRDATDQLQTIGGRAKYMSAEDRIRVRTMLAYSVDLCRSAARSINDHGGSSAHYLSSPAQRYLRDITVIATHAIFDTSSALALHGRVQAGLPPNSDWFK